jgi:hypothetical protein
MSLYRSIFRQAWDITWQYKYLWFFGFFAALLGNGGEYEILSKGLRGDMSQGTVSFLRGTFETGLFSSQGLSNLMATMKTDPYTVLTIFLVGLLSLALFIFVIWLVMISQGALVNNAAMVKMKKKTDFQSNINSGIGNFWGILGLNLISKSLIYLIFGIISIAIIFSNMFYGLLFIIFIPVAISISFIIKYAVAYLVVKKTAFIESISKGWNLFFNNWLVSLEMAFLLFFINLFVGLCLVVLLIILSVPFLFLIILFNKFASVFFFFIMAGFSVVLFLSLVFIIGSMLATFQVSAWTTLFMELESKGGVSRLHRFFGKK